MTSTSISDAPVWHFCHFYMLNVPANLTFFKISQLGLQNNYFIIDPFWNSFVHARNMATIFRSEKL